MPRLVVSAGSYRRGLEDCAHAGHEQPDDENDADDDAEQNATHSLSTDAVISRSVSKPGAEAAGRGGKRRTGRAPNMKSSSSSGRQGSSASLTLEGPEWRLSDHLGPDGALVPLAEDVAATASFMEGRVSGTTGCNRYSGSYGVDAPSLSFGALAMTRMACMPPRDAAERAMIAALESTAGYTVIGDALKLTDAEGNTVLRFRAATAPGLVGTTWVAAGINKRTWGRRQLRRARGRPRNRHVRRRRIYHRVRRMQRVRWLVHPRR